MINILLIYPNKYYAEGLKTALLSSDEGFTVENKNCAIGVDVGDYDVIITTEDSLLSLCRNDADILSDMAKIMLIVDDLQRYVPEHLFDVSIKSDADIEEFCQKIHLVLETETKKMLRLKRRRDRLSSREYQVAMALLSLKKNKDIGMLLGINEKTVSTYKLRIFNKLCIKSVLQLRSALRLISVI